MIGENELISCYFAYQYRKVIVGPPTFWLNFVSGISFSHDPPFIANKLIKTKMPTKLLIFEIMLILFFVRVRLIHLNDIRTTIFK